MSNKNDQTNVLLLKVEPKPNAEILQELSSRNLDLGDFTLIKQIFAELLDKVALNEAKETVINDFEKEVMAFGWSWARVKQFRKHAIFQCKFYREHCFDHLKKKEDGFIPPIDTSHMTVMELAFYTALERQNKEKRS